MSNDFIIIDEDHCVYTKRSKDKFAIMLLYVDYIIITRNSKKYVNKIKGWLSFNFEMKDMGEAIYILGVKISRNCSKKLFSITKALY